MKRLCVFLLFIAVSAGALAQGFCFKSQAYNSFCHASVSGVSAVVANSILPDEPLYAFGLAMAPGVLKELLDRQGGGSVSTKDILMDALGAGLTLVALKFADGTLTVTPRGLVYQRTFGP